MAAGADQRAENLSVSLFLSFSPTAGVWEIGGSEGTVERGSS